jgi:VanZ family protein
MLPITTNYFQVKPTKNLLALKIFYLCSAIFWTLLIAVLCLVSFNQLPSIGIGGADKFGHITFHFGFTILWFLYLKEASTDLKKPLLKIFAASFLYGIAIEMAQQLFTATRKADFYDVLANTSGAILAVAILGLLDRHKKRKYN